MSHIIKVGNDQINGRTIDSIKYCKNCKDFMCLDDGTIVGEHRYCNLSLQCRQVDVDLAGKSIPMESHILVILDPITGEELNQELFCTGMHDLRPLKERIEDDKIS